MNHLESRRQIELCGCPGVPGEQREESQPESVRMAAPETLHSTWRFMGSYNWVVSPLFGL